MFALVFCALGAYWLLAQSSALSPLPSPRLYISPDSVVTRPGETFTVQVRAHSGDITVNAAQAEIAYPKDRLEFVGLESAGSAFEIDAPSDGGAGRVSIVRGSTSGLTGDGLIASVTFRARVAATGSFVLTFDENSQLLSKADNTNMLVSLAQTRGTTVRIDGEAPQVSVTTPAVGVLIRGVVDVKATAADGAGSGVSKVEFYVAGVKIGEDAVSPYEIKWDSSVIADGSREVSARAYDRARPANVTNSQPVTITVDNTPPTAPSGLRIDIRTAGSLGLAWDASYDAGNITAYRLTRNGAAAVTLPGTARTQLISGLTPNTGYVFNVIAVDAAGNVSVPAVVAGYTATNKSGDLNGDLMVSVLDLSILLTQWNSAHAASDINDDGVVNITDLSILLANWGTK
jgi:hypothetical protein